MAEIKEMTIPLRAAWNVPRTYRAKRAMAEVRLMQRQRPKLNRMPRKLKVTVTRGLTRVNAQEAILVSLITMRPRKVVKPEVETPKGHQALLAGELRHQARKC